jgi:transcriptional regulator with XRE-family HTH domain
MADLQEMTGAVIRRERRERHLTMRELAARSSLSEVYLSEIERGKKYPSALVLERLAEALGLDVADLLEFVADSLREAAHPTVTRAVGYQVPNTDGEAAREEARPTVTRAVGFTLPERADAPPRVVVKRLAQALGAEDVTLMAELGTFFLSRRGGAAE